MEYKDPSKYIPIIYLLYSWGSRFGVPLLLVLRMRKLFGGLGVQQVSTTLLDEGLGFRV